MNIYVTFRTDHICCRREIGVEFHPNHHEEVAVTDTKYPGAADIEANNAADAIPEHELDQVTGGLVVRKAGEHPLEF